MYLTNSQSIAVFPRTGVPSSIEVMYIILSRLLSRPLLRGNTFPLTSLFIFDEPSCARHLYAHPLLPANCFLCSNPEGHINGEPHRCGTPSVFNDWFIFSRRSGRREKRRHILLNIATRERCLRIGRPIHKLLQTLKAIGGVIGVAYFTRCLFRDSGRALGVQTHYERSNTSIDM